MIRCGDDLAVTVAPARQAVHPRLQDVLEEREPARHVAVERRVADAHLTLVAGRQHEPPELVRERHDEVSSNACLDVLLRHVGLGAGECVAERRVVVLHELGDWDLEQADIESARQIGGVVLVHLGREARRHRDGGKRIGADRIGRDHERECRVDAARQAEHGVREPVLAEVVAPCRPQAPRRPPPPAPAVPAGERARAPCGRAARTRPTRPARARSDPAGAPARACRRRVSSTRWPDRGL